MAGIEIDGVNNKIDLDDDKDTSISANVDDKIVVEAGGTNTLFINNGTVGIGNEPDLGDGLHVKKADSSADAFTDTVAVLENSGDTRLSILSGTSNEGEILFGDSGLNRQGRLAYRHGSDSFVFQTSNSEELYLTSGGTLSVGDSSPDADGGGLTLNQGANDSEILTLKSSDISHGFTGQFEADTYGVFKKNSSSAGGLQILGIAEDDPGINIFGVADTSSGTVASNTNAIIHIDARKTTGGSVGTIGSDMLCLFSNDGAAKVIITGTGKIHSDSSATIGTYDEYDDAHLVRAYDLYNGKGVIDSKFDKFISYNAEKLADLELIGRDDDGTPNSFVDITGFQRLHNGAIWQQYEKTQNLANAMYELAKAAVGEEKANEILEKNDVKLLKE